MPPACVVIAKTLTQYQPKRKGSERGMIHSYQESDMILTKRMK